MNLAFIIIELSLFLVRNWIRRKLFENCISSTYSLCTTSYSFVHYEHSHFLQFVKILKNNEIFSFSLFTNYTCNLPRYSMTAFSFDYVSFMLCDCTPFTFQKQNPHILTCITKNKLREKIMLKYHANYVTIPNSSYDEFIFHLF